MAQPYNKQWDEEIYRQVNDYNKEALDDWLLELQVQGKTEKTIASLVLSGPCHPIHIVNIDKYNTHGGTSDTAAISLHEPAL